MPCFGRSKKSKKSISSNPPSPSNSVDHTDSKNQSVNTLEDKTIKSLKGKALYDYLKNFIKPLDLIAFRGGDVISDLITVLEKFEVGVSDFSHVGLVVTSDILEYYEHEDKTFTLEKDKIYVLESTFSYDIGDIVEGGGFDVIKQKGYFGVQLRDLEEVVQKYISSNKTKIAWCQLTDNPFDEVDARPLVRKMFTKLFKKYYEVKYDLDVIDLTASIFPCLRDLREVKDVVEKKLCKLFNHFHEFDTKQCPSGWQFCSELVANIYQGLGIIDKKIDTRNVLPVDYFGSDQDGVPKLVDEPIYFENW